MWSFVFTFTNYYAHIHVTSVVCPDHFILIHFITLVVGGGTL
jgi:hypothetical protein